MNLNPIKEYAKAGLNVIFTGPHGVGKTTIVREIFDELFPGKYVCLSGATLDPFLDLIGIPVTEEDEQGNKFINLIRPKNIPESIEAIFIDEYNRAPKAVRNATMELIQSKSIHGRGYPNLKVVWAAENPIDAGYLYDVEELDPAQRDRFHLNIHFTNKPDRTYFISKYKSVGEKAVDWWSNDLSEERQKKVSPRKLEDVIKIFNKIGNIDNVLPKEISTTTLLPVLRAASSANQLDTFVDKLKDNYQDTALIDSLIEEFNQAYPTIESFNQIKPLLANDFSYVPITALVLPEEYKTTILSAVDAQYTAVYTAFCQQYSPKQDSGVWTFLPNTNTFDSLGNLTDSGKEQLKMFETYSGLEEIKSFCEQPQFPLPQDLVDKIQEINVAACERRDYNLHCNICKDVVVMNFYIQAKHDLNSIGRPNLLSLNTFAKSSRVYDTRNTKLWVENAVDNFALNFNKEMNPTEVSQIRLNVAPINHLR